ncbi:MAG: DNA-binding protein [Bacteroidota bacterium]
MQSYRDKGLIGFSQVGKKVFFSQNDIDEFLQSKTQQQAEKWK